ncbi:MAG TPA: glucan ABC transporter ATP-binding protein/ permease [Burkholderiales bacterium]|nr:glucan ABC transporter ATP-binding protein/ permease [Burkholderiales bacterium]
MTFVQIYLRALRLLGAEKRAVFALALANAAVATLFFVEPILFGRLIDVLGQAATQPAAQVMHACLVTLGAWGIVGLAGVFSNFLLALGADRLAHRHRLAVTVRYFEHVLALSFAFHSETHSARLLRTMLRATGYLFGFWLAFFREHMGTVITLTVLLPLSMLLNWKLGLLLIVFMFAFTAITTFGIRRTEVAQASVEAGDSELSARVGDAFANVRLIQSYVRRAAEASALAQLTRRILGAQYPILAWWAGLNVLTRAASTLTVIGIFALGTWLTLRGEASVGQIVTFMGFASLMMGRLEQVGRFISQMFAEMPAVANFFEILDTQSQIRDRPGAVSKERLHGDVEYDDVSFAYKDAPAVSHIGFRAASGNVVALVGPTGAGKTTAASLLMRLHDPQHGCIRVDGIDIRAITLDSLRKNVGVVFQDSALLHRSIAENIGLGDLHASTADIVRAARLAEAHEFILGQPRGYDTVVGERGSTLSGAERQRLAIARALLKDPPILILDEATSSLDSVTEASVQRALSALMKGRTTFVIAHRLSTIRSAVLILVFDRGRIVERGKHDALVALDGLYARLVRAQTNATDTAPAA